MEGSILAMFIISPIAICLGCYQAFNGRMPCIHTEHIDNINRVAVEE